ncbi:MULTISPECIES: glucoamylase family protein [unclassified Arenibacter]|uniref:glucoamylase family protein n=1 Tax=unclassified Arenibacter TaxID=2615047 RepID=UPI000E354868|nr:MULTISPECIES: glucoamylase family protein [unclassified Arenibacter]MCM4165402.1 beta-glucosidase [Arenibacter sp. A80]RFT54878.1 beta-glucosidase [Arenibacter sp. P308M17]
MIKNFELIIIALFFVCCSGDDAQGLTGESQLPDLPIVKPPVVEAISDEELLDLTQKETFKYFWDYAETNSGCARERYHPNNPAHDANTVTTGGTGFGLMAILVGIERNYITREQAVTRLQKMLGFLESADRFHGAWPHWLDGNTGKVRPFSEMDNGGDLVETAFLAQGLISVKEYFKEGSLAEKELAAKADILWKGVEWNWYTQNQNVLYWHWSPNNGFAINLQLKGYNETLITYVLAAASPDYSISKEVYTNGWASNGGIKSNKTTYNYPLLVKHPGSETYGGPLFFSHYSFLGLNPIGLKDGFVDYGEVSVNHANINYRYAVENPKQFLGYGPDCWGLTASYSRNSDGSMGYNAHSPANDVGVVSPTAAISSIPYTPVESLKAMQYFYQHKDKLLGPAGFYDAFSPQHNFWVAEAYLAIDQGPQIIMIENYRSGLLWGLFMQNEEVKTGLIKLGFTYES